MAQTFAHEAVAKWFFLLLATGVVYLFWRVLEPFAMVLLTAGIAAVLATPLERRLRKVLRHPHLSSFVVTLFVFCIIVGPLAIAAVVMVDQALDLARVTVGNPQWVANFRLAEHPAFALLPRMVRDSVLSLDLAATLREMASWASSNVGAFFSSGVELVYKTFLFFICLYFFLLERERIAKEVIALSPLKDSVDRTIAVRLVETVRGVVFGSLIVAVVQGILAAIGLTIFGVPGPLIWAACVVIAAQVPMLGTSTVMLPAVAYLFIIGDVPAAIGLLIWSACAVGLIDNVLQPYVVGGKTRMHALLILLSMLGGLQYFGPVGFIAGPTVLAAFLVMLELYKAGMLEKRGTA